MFPSSVSTASPKSWQPFPAAAPAPEPPASSHHHHFVENHRFIDSLLDDDDELPPPPSSNNTAAANNNGGSLEEEETEVAQWGFRVTASYGVPSCSNLPQDAADDDDAASVRSSPDDRYAPPEDEALPLAAAAAADTTAAAPAAPAASVPAKTLVPFRCFGSLDGDCADALELEELEASSARNDDDNTSYNGGTTDEGETDDEEDQDAVDGDVEGEGDGERELNGLSAPADGGEHHLEAGGAHHDADSMSYRSASGGSFHPFLDLDAQRRQVDWERAQQRASYHAEMQRKVSLTAADRTRALQCLMNEAHRFHRRHRSAGRPHVEDNVWYNLADSVDDDLTASGPPTVQRNLSCMCIFSTVSAARDYGDHEDERSRRQAGQHRTLQALRMQVARGGSPYFLSAPVVRCPATPVPASSL